MVSQQARRRVRPVPRQVEPGSDLVAHPSVQATLGNDVAKRAFAGDDIGGLGTVARSAMLRAIGDDPSLEALVGLGSGGVPLPEAMRARFEAAMGHDFGHVRIHADARAADSAADLSAEAFALGSHVYFSASAWSPGSADTDRLLAHELTHVVQADEGRLPSGGGVSQPTDPAEREAYGDEGRIVSQLPAAQGLAASPIGPAISGAAAHPKLTFPKAARKTRLALVGDGTPAHPGLKFGELQGYVAGQADWFSEPTLTAADRDTVWRMLLVIERKPELGTPFANLGIGETAALPAADLAALGRYAAGFDPAGQTVRLQIVAPDLARALVIGRALTDLAGFVPAPVLRVVIPESGLVFLVDGAKLGELRLYYTLFQPTLEHPDEWTHVEALLTEGIGPNMPLMGWVHDLHVFSQGTRTRLMHNIADTGKTKPALLILFSGTDWNSAFLASSELEGVVTSDKNHALLVQGPSSVAAATRWVTHVADTYGQTRTVWDWDQWEWVQSPGELGQVVIAGHGSALTVELATVGANPQIGGNDQYVTYDGSGLDGAAGPGSDTETLIDTILARSTPSGAHIVFAGCLVGSHEVSAGLNLADPLTAEAALRADLAAHPNLADYVRTRIAASNKPGDVQAANASTPFGSLGLDGSGRAELNLSWDPAIAGPKVDYLQTGAEPEGALRAAMECFADPAIGPAKTTALMRIRLAGLAGVTDYWLSLVRAAFAIALPPAPADVNIGKVNDLSHRVATWLLADFASSMDVAGLAGSVKAGEHATVYTAMLASDNKEDHMQVGVPEAWMSADPAEVPRFAAALDASTFDRATLTPQLVRAFVDPHLAALLPASPTPTRGQMLLALTIAVQDAAGMPAPVRELLRAAAGGRATAAFPAGRDVPALLAGMGEAGVLDDIGLAVGSGGGGGSIAANVDLNRNGRNDRFVAVNARETTAVAEGPVHARASSSSRVLATLKVGGTVRVMGTTGAWSMIDDNGRTGFVTTTLLA